MSEKREDPFFSPTIFSSIGYVFKLKLSYWFKIHQIRFFHIFNIFYIFLFFLIFNNIFVEKSTIYLYVICTIMQILIEEIACTNIIYLRIEL
jgi:hypothetical protein